MKHALLLFCLICCLGVNAQQTNLESEHFPVTADANPFIRQIDDSIICYSYTVGRILYHVCNYLHNSAPCYTETFVAGFDNNSMYPNGPTMSFFPNGKPERACNYIYGCLSGSYAEWYANGKLKTRGEYWLDVNDTLAYLNNFHHDTSVVINPITLSEELIIVSTETLQLKHGRWQYYDSTGTMLNEEMWDKGVLIKQH